MRIEEILVYILKNGSWLGPDGTYHAGSLRLDGDYIDSVDTDSRAGDVCDMTGLRILPGLIDVHTHGAIGYDTMKATPEQIAEWSRFLARHGVTAFFPTTLTASMEDIRRALGNVREAARSPHLGAAIMGAHIEGPFLSAKFKGTHEETLLCDPSIEETDRFREILGPKLLLRMTVAPERPGAMELIRHIRDFGGTVSVGHCDASYEVACRALEAGATSFTHVFNAMRGLHHREPGTVGAALTTDSFTEAICDGIHLHPATVKLIYRTKGPDKMVAITDAMQAAGLRDGDYPFAGAMVHVEGGVARNPAGNLAGSTLLLCDGVKNIAKFAGIAPEQALQTATLNPARAVGLDRITGSIVPGKLADLIAVDSQGNIRCTFCRGRLVYDAAKGE